MHSLTYNIPELTFAYLDGKELACYKGADLSRRKEPGCYEATVPVILSGAKNLTCGDETTRHVRFFAPLRMTGFGGYKTCNNLAYIL
jgi:hypothetical protein